jgi:hypothetical protein
VPLCAADIEAAVSTMQATGPILSLRISTLVSYRPSLVMLVAGL